MAKQTLNNLATYLEQRTKINENFTELYDFKDASINEYDIHTLHVSKGGNDTIGNGKANNPYLTIKKAIDSITDNSETIRYVIKIHPGIYNELNPLVMKAYVIISGEGDVRLTPTDINSTMFTAIEFSTIENITIAGVTNAPAYNFTNTGNVILRDIVFINCKEGIFVNNASIRVDVYNSITLITSGTMDNIVNCQAGLINLTNTAVITGSSITTLIYVNGVNSFVTIDGLDSFGASITNGIYVNNGGFALIVTIGIEGAVYGLRANNNSMIRGAATSIVDSSAYDIFQEDTNSKITLASTDMNFNKVSVKNWKNVTLNVMSTIEGDESSIVTAKFHIGIPEQGFDAYLGEGSSSARDIMVYTFNGGFTNVSSQAQSASSSTFTSGKTVGSMMYLSWNLQQDGDFKKFYGARFNITTAMVVGTGSYIWEYWNGTAWTAFEFMITELHNSSLSRANKFAGETGEHHIRFNMQLSGLIPPFNEDGLWTKNDPIVPATGTDRYWTRFRIINEITTAPVFEQVRLHTNKMKVHADGWAEFFGIGRPTATFPVDFGLTTPTTETAQQPTDHTLYVSDHLYLTRLVNGFRDGKVDLTSYNAVLPANIDTSTPVLFLIHYIVDADTSGDIDWQVNYGITQPGDSIYLSTADAPTQAPNEKIINIADTISINSSEKEKTLGVTLDLSNGIAFRDDGSADKLWITLKRKGDTDSYGGTVILMNMTIRYVQWNNGAHFINS